jgi:hypothetical protein
MEIVAKDELARQLSMARAVGLQTVLAGRLSLDRLGDLPLEHADMVAVRGAACRAGRTSAICAERVAALREAMHRHASCSRQGAIAADMRRDGTPAACRGEGAPISLTRVVDPRY